MSGSCPFCAVDSSRVFYEHPLVMGLWDGFPVSPGHALLIPRRHVASWFDATPEEHAALLEGIRFAHDILCRQHQPDGFNIGINVNEAAGQTVFHLHVHVIPRYRGDMGDPRGGVRQVIPGKGNYTVDPPAALPSLNCSLHGRALVRGDHDPLLPHLLADLDRAWRIDVAMAFVVESGVRLVDEHLRDLLDRGGRVRFLTGDYLGVTDPTALRQLLDLEGDIDLRVFQTVNRSFHPKAIIFQFPDGSGTAYVGSSNLTETALRTGVEWNYRVVTSGDEAGFDDVRDAFEALYQHPDTAAVDAGWIWRYEQRRQPTRSRDLAVLLEPALPPPVPHSVQAEALKALAATRRAGNSAGLVVLATGLGKTWLGAFDSNQPEFTRVLFVAHREEILTQAIKTFRRIRPQAEIGRYDGTNRQSQADLLFASVQTLGKGGHRERFKRDAFDYIVIDEFHHASARTYRNIIDYFQPRFLLGLTATPERTDGGDLLALCQENLVYRRDVFEGIERGLLCPFRYFGVPDSVDYSNIPWRRSRFDEEELTAALATDARAGNALEQHRIHGGSRTLAFCCSQRHADFMAAYFNRNGIGSVAVHAGSSSAPRARSLERLNDGELQVVFAVDMFNEGVDIPAIDTVLMLRPTESGIIWQQQFGRGLRRSEGKERLTVIDYIGNHRVFLTKLRTLWNLGSGDQEIERVLNLLVSNEARLPPGCEVTYDLEATDIIRALLSRPSSSDAFKAYYRDFKERHGTRPSAVEAFHDGYRLAALRKKFDSWFGFVDSMGDLSPVEAEALGQHGDFLRHLETTPMEKSYKMIALLAMLNADQLPGGMPIAALTNGFRSLAERSAQLRKDVGPSMENDVELQRHIEKNPVKYWAGGKGTGGRSYFAYREGTFASTFTVEPGHRPAFQELAREIIDLRLVLYLDRAREGAGDEGSAQRFECRVSHSAGQPMLFLPDRRAHPDIPTGKATVMADEVSYEADFVKVKVNVMRGPASYGNALPDLLRKWFGPNAGRPGTNFRVEFVRKDSVWNMNPVGDRR